MSFRPRTQALDPQQLALLRFDSKEQQPHENVKPFASPPAVTVPPSSPSTPSNFNLMTERQQLAYLMRATSEGDSGNGKGSRRSLLQAKKSLESEEDDDDDDESDSSDSSSDEGDDSNDDDNGSDSDSAVSLIASSPIISLAPPPATTSTGSTKKVAAAATEKENDLHPRAIRRPVEYALWPSDKQKRWDGIYTNPNLFYYHHVGPGIVLQTSTDWSEREKNHFLFTLENHPPENCWGLFSMNIPGRTGLQCETFAKKLIKEGTLVQTGCTKKNPMGTLRLANKEKSKYKFETTPILVARVPSSSVPSIKLSTIESDALLSHELRTTIARLSLDPFPGTSGMKEIQVFRTERSQAKALVKEQTEKRKKEKEQEESTARQEKERLEKEKEKDRIDKEKERERVERERVERLKKQQDREPPSTPISPHSAPVRSQRTPTDRFVAPTTPLPSGSGSGSGSNKRYDAAGPGSGSVTISGSSPDSSHITSPNQSQERDDSIDAVTSSSAQEVAPRSNRKRDSISVDVQSEKISVAPVLPSQTGIDKITPSVTSSSPVAVDHSSHSSSAALFDSLPDVPLIGTRSVTAAHSSTLLPFSSFAIPAHTPYVSAKRQKVSASLPPRVLKLDESIPTPVQMNPYPIARFRSEEDELVTEFDVRKNEAVLKDGEGRIIRKGRTHAPSVMNSSSYSTHHVDDMDIDSGFSSYSSELSKLDSSFRLKLRRLAVHQSTQLARLRPFYGVPTLNNDEMNSSNSIVDDDVEGIYYGYRRLTSSLHPTLARPFHQSHAAFTSGCKNLLQNYFNRTNDHSTHGTTAPTLDQQTENEAIQVTIDTREQPETTHRKASSSRMELFINRA